MEERFRFVLRLLEGEDMSSVCREFGISRKTGYKIFERYKDQGLESLSDRSRRPVRYGNQLPEQVETAIVRFKREKPHWGARKIREMLVRQIPNDVRIPAVSTVHAVMDRHGLVSPMGRRRSRAEGTALSPGDFPNDLWCVDFKGEFMLGSKRYCYPLTVTDYTSRYLLLCEALESTKEVTAMASFERLFRERVLRSAIRSDIGVPFALHIPTESVHRFRFRWNYAAYMPRSLWGGFGCKRNRVGLPRRPSGIRLLLCQTIPNTAPIDQT